MSAFAVIAAGGRQYRVAPGDHVRVDRLGKAAGEAVTFERVLMIGSEAGVRVGTPVLTGAVVRGQVIDELRDRKVMVFKKRRNKTYRRMRGHRQWYTLVHIDAIEG
ncbi:MAG: 50S ribosomal protein L21 [Acidobacteriota bacterium]